MERYSGILQQYHYGYIGLFLKLMYWCNFLIDTYPVGTEKYASFNKSGSEVYANEIPGGIPKSRYLLK